MIDTPKTIPAQLSSNSRKLLRWFLQIAIGGIIIGSALGKALDLPGFVEVLKTYQAFPPVALFPLAVAVAVGEFVLGVWLLSGHHLQSSALWGARLNLFYAIWMTITLLRGLELDNCGCFGVFFPRPLIWVSPLEDLVMVAFCCILAYLAGGYVKTRTVPHKIHIET